MQADDAAARLDRYLNALLLDDPAPKEGIPPRSRLEPATAATAKRLARLAAAPDPDPAFAAGLRRRLLAPNGNGKRKYEEVAAMGIVAIGPGFARPGTDRAKLSAPERRAGAWLATAALLVLTLVGAVTASRLGGAGEGAPATQTARDADEPPVQAGFVVGTPAAAECTVAPRTEVPDPPITGNIANLAMWLHPSRPVDYAFELVAMSFVGATPARAEAKQGIARTLREAGACQRAGDRARELALYSDTYLRDSMEGVWDVEAFEPTPTALGDVPLARFGQSEPVGAGAWRLNTSEVAAVVTTDADDLLVVFAQAGDRWLIDEFTSYPPSIGIALPDPADLHPSGLPPLGVVLITLFDDSGSPTQVNIPADTDVPVAVSNVGTTFRTFSVPALGLVYDLAPGQLWTFTIAAPAGTITPFFSDEFGERASGPVGSIVATGAGSSPGRSSPVPALASCDIVPRAEVSAVPSTGAADDLLGEPGSRYRDARLAVLLEGAELVAAETAARVAATIDAAAACRAAGDLNAEAALYSDHYLARALARSGDDGVATPDAALRRAMAAAPLFVPSPAPTPGPTWRLFNDQVATVATTRDGPLFVVLSRLSDRWLIDEIAPYPFQPEEPPPAAHEVSGGALPPLDLAIVSITDDGVVPNVVSVVAGARVRVVVTNSGTADRTFRIAGTTLEMRVAAGETDSTWIELPKGTYGYTVEHTAVPGVDSSAMNGTLIAVDSWLGTPVP